MKREELVMAVLEIVERSCGPTHRVGNLELLALSDVARLSYGGLQPGQSPGVKLLIGLCVSIISREKKSQQNRGTSDTGIIIPVRS